MPLPDWFFLMHIINLCGLWSIWDQKVINPIQLQVIEVAESRLHFQVGSEISLLDTETYIRLHMGPYGITRPQQVKLRYNISHSFISIWTLAVKKIQCSIFLNQVSTRPCHVSHQFFRSWSGQLLQSGYNCQSMTENVCIIHNITPEVGKSLSWKYLAWLKETLINITFYLIVDLW